MQKTVYRHLAQKALLIKGQFRDKEELIKVAKAETKKAFGVSGKIRVIEIEGYKEHLNGQVVVVEFEFGREYTPSGSGRRELRKIDAG